MNYNRSMLKLNKIREELVIRGPLSILLWKHRKERIRRLSHTIVELFFALLVFLILVLLKHLLVKFKVNNKLSSFRKTEILYTPHNAISDSLMSSICHHNISFGSVECLGFESSSNLWEYTDKDYSNDSKKYYDARMIINFTNLYDNKFPLQLHYTVKCDIPRRKPEPFLDLFRIFYKDYERPLNATDHANVLWNINKAYLQQVSGDLFEHTIHFHDISEHTTPEMKVIHSFLIVCTVLAPLSYFLYTASLLVFERRTGLNAMMKFVGVSSYTVRMAGLLDTSMFAVLLGIVITILLKITSTPILVSTNPVIVVITILLYFLIITSLAFITSSLSQNYQHADSVSLLMYLLTFWLNMLWYRRKIDKVYRLIICCLLPHAPVFMFWDDVTFLEDMAAGPKLEHIFLIHHPTGSGPIILIWLCFIIQIVIYQYLAWYFDKIRPGKYGIALPSNFLFKKKFWTKKKRRGVNFHVTAERSGLILKDDRFFEAPPGRKTKVAIKIAQISKVFQSYKKEPIQALNCINLNVYQGEITVILGTNGAGKSTLLSIITGMYSQTRGSVYINGLDNSLRFQDLKKDLAYCPQNCIVFSYLTVRENLMFFQWLRGKKQSTVANAEFIISTLKMKEYVDYYSHELSDGMKRCLQVACTLVCDAEVLVLDEPTSGMDAQMRFDVWDVLLSLRRLKTILLATTVIEEADALGDRIALINRGKLKCHGSPRFLKEAIGADFVLSVRLNDEARGDPSLHRKIKETIKGAGLHRPTAARASVISTAQAHTGRVSVHLPANERKLFPEVFNLLEAKGHELQISNMNVGISMEQVFLRFVEDDNTEILDPALKYHTHVGDSKVELLKGVHLSLQQFRVLTMRAFMFVWMNRYQFIFLQLMVPIIALIILTLTSNIKEGFVEVHEIEFHPPHTLVLYEPVGYRRKDVLDPLGNRYPEIKFEPSTDLRTDISNLTHYGQKNNIIGFKMNGSQTDIYFPVHYHQEYFDAVNIFTGIYVSLHMPYALRTGGVNTTVQMTNSKVNTVQPKNLYLALAWSTWVAFLAIVPLAPLILLCIEEFSTGVRFNHLLSGCSSSIIWLSKLTAHMIVYTIVPILIIAIAAVLDTDQSINQPDYLIAAFIMLEIYGPAFLIYWYAFSYVMNERDYITKIYVFCLAAGLVGPTFVHFFKEMKDFHESLNYILVPIYIILSFSPMFTFSVGLGRLTVAARTNALCKLNFHFCPNIEDDIYLTKEACCNSVDGKPFKYYTGLGTGALELTLLGVHCVFYWVVLIMLQRRVIQYYKEKFLSKVFKKPAKRIENDRIQEEENRVREKINKFRTMTKAERQQDPDMLIVDKMYKSFGIRTGKINNAVRGVSFAVKKGECLGILGRGGAGKTTTLAMVSGYTTCSAGTTCCHGYFLRDQRRKYLKQIAWAKMSGLDEFLTGYKNLEILALILGYKRGQAQSLAMDYLNYMGLSPMAHVLFGSYSPGCVRRIVMCNALFSKPRVALFDEPCNSVDPHARPLVIRAIKRLLNRGTSCVIAEENAEWMYIERIWTRLAILSHGEMIAIGTVPEIRQEFGCGYSATLKLKVDDAYFVIDDLERVSNISMSSFKNFVPLESTNSLKTEFLELFEGSVLVSENLSMLYFHIRDRNRELLYSEMFTKLEMLREKYQIIEDYTLSEVSVSEILYSLEKFLSATSSEKPIVKIDMDKIFMPMRTTATTQDASHSLASSGLIQRTSSQSTHQPKPPQRLKQEESAISLASSMTQKTEKSGNESEDESIPETFNKKPRDSLWGKKDDDSSGKDGNEALKPESPGPSGLSKKSASSGPSPSSELDDEEIEQKEFFVASVSRVYSTISPSRHSIDSTESPTKTPPDKETQKPEGKQEEGTQKFGDESSEKPGPSQEDSKRTDVPPTSDVSEQPTSDSKKTSDGQEAQKPEDSQKQLEPSLPQKDSKTSHKSQVSERSSDSQKKSDEHLISWLVRLLLQKIKSTIEINISGQNSKTSPDKLEAHESRGSEESENNQPSTSKNADASKNEKDKKPDK